MKNYKTLYWITTILFSVFMLFSSYLYLGTDQIKNSFVGLGFPDYFRLELGIAKLLGAIALALPAVPRPIKGFAYAGFVINLVSALIAHLAVSDPVSTLVVPFLALIVLALSYQAYTKLDKHVND